MKYNEMINDISQFTMYTQIFVSPHNCIVYILADIGGYNNLKHYYINLNREDIELASKNLPHFLGVEQVSDNDFNDACFETGTTVLNTFLKNCGLIW